jgi:hypothetical protein
LPKNIYVRIALIVVLVILLYYLVVVLGRSAAGADTGQMPPAAWQHSEASPASG